MSGVAGAQSGTQEVDETFAHNDIPGTYSLDTGSFTTSSAHSTSDSYSLVPDASADDDRLIVRDDMELVAGNRYEFDVYHQSDSGADMGVVFCVQDGVTGWSDFTGYLALFESDDDEIRVDRWDDGAQGSYALQSTTWPTDEWLTVELDFRASDESEITMTVADADGAAIDSVTLFDTTYDSGGIGWYNWHASSDWFADSWTPASAAPSAPANLSSPWQRERSVHLSWDSIPASDLDHYNVYVDGTLDHQPGAEMTGTDVEGLAEYTTYDVHLTAVDADGNESERSDTVSVTTRASPRGTEDFSHADVPGAYSLDTGAFTVSSARSTSDSYSLVPDASSDGDRIIVHDDLEVTSGDIVDFDVYHRSDSGADMGVVFGVQDGVTGWSDFTGYLAIFESDDDEIRVDRWEDGVQVDTASTATTWPTEEWLTAEVKFLTFEGGDVVMTVYDNGAELASVSLDDDTYESGTVGWYNWHASSDWFVDTWIGSVYTLEDFRHQDISETYTLDTRSFTTAEINQRPTSTGRFGEHSLQPAADADADQLVLREDRPTLAGTDYNYYVSLPSGVENDMGFLFGAQPDTTSWSDYTGYMAFFDSGEGEIRVDYWQDGTWADHAATAVTWPTDEWLRVALDYRDSDDSTIEMNLFDADGNLLDSVSLAHTTIDTGVMGWYNYFAESNWYADGLYR